MVGVYRRIEPALALGDAAAAIRAEALQVAREVISGDVDEDTAGVANDLFGTALYATRLEGYLRSAPREQHQERARQEHRS